MDILFYVYTCVCTELFVVSQSFMPYKYKLFIPKAVLVLVLFLSVKEEDFNSKPSCNLIVTLMKNCKLSQLYQCHKKTKVIDMFLFCLPELLPFPQIFSPWVKVFRMIPKFRILT